MIVRGNAQCGPEAVSPQSWTNLVTWRIQDFLTNRGQRDWYSNCSRINNSRSLEWDSVETASAQMLLGWWHQGRTLLRNEYGA